MVPTHPEHQGDFRNAPVWAAKENHMTHTDAITRATRAFHKRQTGLRVMIEEPNAETCDYRAGTVILRNDVVGELARYRVTGAEGRERFEWFGEE
jgi:hypothetical protein